MFEDDPFDIPGSINNWWNEQSTGHYVDALGNCYADNVFNSMASGLTYVSGPSVGIEDMFYTGIDY